MSVIYDKSDFDGYTILIGNGDNNEYVNISGHEIVIFKTEDKVTDYKSPVDIIMIVPALAIGEIITLFRSDHFTFIENEKIEEGSLLNSIKKRLTLLIIRC